MAKTLKEEKIAYTVHPVSAEMKAELRGKGYKIIDARFAGKDDEIFNQPKIGNDLPNEGTVDWYKLKLTDAGIEFEANATKVTLVELYNNIDK